MAKEAINSIEKDEAVIIHHGHTLKRFRNAKRLKQLAVAKAVFGEDGQQSKIARLENTAVIKDDILQKFADYYNVNIEILKNMEQDPIQNIVNNTFENGSVNNINQGNLEEGSVNNLGSGDQIVNNPLEEVLKLTKEKDALLQQIIEKDQEREKQLLKALELALGKIEKK